MRRFLRLAVLVVPILFLAVPAAHAVVFTAPLDGPSEFPPVPSPATGFALVEFDILAHTLHVVASFGDLIGTTTAAHIHCCVAADGWSGHGGPDVPRIPPRGDFRELRRDLRHSAGVDV